MVQGYHERQVSSNVVAPVRVMLLPAPASHGRVTLCEVRLAISEATHFPAKVCRLSVQRFRQRRGELWHLPGMPRALVVPERQRLVYTVIMSGVVTWLPPPSVIVIVALNVPRLVYVWVPVTVNPFPPLFVPMVPADGVVPSPQLIVAL